MASLCVALQLLAVSEAPRYWVGQLVRAAQRIELKKAKGKRSTFVGYGDVGRVTEAPGDVDGSVAEVHFFRGEAYKENRGFTTDVFEGQIEPIVPEEVKVGAHWEQLGAHGHWYRVKITKAHEDGRTFDTSVLHKDFDDDTGADKKDIVIPWGKNVDPQHLRRPALTYAEWYELEKALHLEKKADVPERHAAAPLDQYSSAGSDGEL
eukprot:TRINITY_DN28593_c0_g1_i1.p1 TRINITY_DN28593_c0_g1~~TRINITY_DN28593_c0_g1_i1.p1  ORF type:complete len:226 (+),score=55.86 TRINITY_DN28593_c0_g1_i1:60-680(+)